MFWRSVTEKFSDLLKITQVVSDRVRILFSPKCWSDFRQQTAMESGSVLSFPYETISLRNLLKEIPRVWSRGAATEKSHTWNKKELLSDYVAKMFKIHLSVNTSFVAH